jgi:DNA-directed RNA polymerase subunit RPC12/RpoP
MSNNNSNNDYNVLNISKDSFRPKKYFCNRCNRRLFLKDKETQEYLCTFCNIIYYPNNQLVKKANRFETPGPETDSQGNVIANATIPIAMIDEPNRELSSTSYKKQKLTAAYEASSRHGFKFTTYEER